MLSLLFQVSSVEPESKDLAQTKREVKVASGNFEWKGAFLAWAQRTNLPMVEKATQ